MILFYYIFSINNKIFDFENVLIIKKNQSIEKIIKQNLPSVSIVDLWIFKIYYKINSIVRNDTIHYGHFNIVDKISFIELLNIISKPSNIVDKITIVEGWSQKDLNAELSKYFEDFRKINYDEILADTYYFNKYDKFDKFYEKLINYKHKFINEKINNKFFENYSKKELFIIGSMIEKEGLDYEDKKNISSVIINRLNKNMRLQIDATVIYALTDGYYNLGRQLTLNDLKTKHPYNTYFINGMPPQPISYVGVKTIELILENYKTDYLFYFFNKSLNKHIFSKNYEQHKSKLNEYRNIK